MEAIQSLLTTAPILAAMIGLAAMGGWAAERGGVVDIGLEGKALAGALAAAWVAERANAPLSLVAAIGAATLLALLHWVATQKLRIDHVVSGMAINLIAAGATGSLAVASDVPGRNGAIFDSWSYVIVAAIAPILLAIVAARTRFGLRLTAVGADPEKSRLMGIRPAGVRLVGLLLTGLFTGLSGALIYTYTANFSKDMVAGRGYIALAALILGGWRPIPTAIVALLFGIFVSLKDVFQGVRIGTVEVPSQAWAALPYIVTVVALAGFLGRSRTPAGLGKA